MVGGLYESTEVGFSQGGNISPLLSNVMLNELDKELERRKLRYVRFADDTVIFVKSRRSAERVSEGVTKFIEEKLKLKVNQGKTSIRNATKIKYLGFSFYVTRLKKVSIRIHPKSIKKMKDRIREMTKRSSGWGYAKLKEKLTQYIRGWVNYFKIADIKSQIKRTDERLRHKIRCYIWKSWKKPKVRHYKLQILGVSKAKARMLAGSREGLWKVSAYQDMNRAITNKKLDRAGYPTFTKYYL